MNDKKLFLNNHFVVIDDAKMQVFSFVYGIPSGKQVGNKWEISFFTCHIKYLVILL
jgi:hypothetical protein